MAYALFMARHSSFDVVWGVDVPHALVHRCVPCRQWHACKSLLLLLLASMLHAHGGTTRDAQILVPQMEWPAADSRADGSADSIWWTDASFII